MSTTTCSRSRVAGTPTYSPRSLSSSPKASETHGLMYYQVTSLVAHDWLESIVRLLTDPPKP